MLKTIGAFTESTDLIFTTVKKIIPLVTLSHFFLLSRHTAKVLAAAFRWNRWGCIRGNPRQGAGRKAGGGASKKTSGIYEPELQ